VTRLDIPGWPDPPARLHFLGICGYAVSGLALALADIGYRVSGSDEDPYPPTTDLLRSAGIPYAGRHSAEGLTAFGRPDLVILGNQVQPGNPELVAALDQGLEVVSEAEAQGRLAAFRPRAVVCGTHGKTTTSTLLAHMLEASGMGPGFRLGATSRNFGLSVRLGELERRSPFVFEGDEYSTSALDRSAKFLHWNPDLVGVLNLELDHPDLYPDLDAYRAPYLELVAGMPPSGRLLLRAGDPAVLQLAEAAASPVTLVGGEEGEWRLQPPPRTFPEGQLLQVSGPAGLRLPLRLPLFGLHNAENALMALALAVALGADPAAAAAAAATFKGPGRRFEVLGEAGGATVVDDYAHHPSKLRATVAAARQMAPGHQLILVHVPHTYSRTQALLPEYREAFTGADLLVLGPIEPARERHLEGSVSSEDVARLVQGPEVVLVRSAGEAVSAVLERVRPPAVVVCCSVRGFDQVAERLLAALAAGERSRGLR
jgi:UDP-N-acetylmuramate--L-alanine ligase